MTDPRLAATSVLVTGGGGFIGPHAVAALRRSGARVTAIAAAPNQTARALPEGVETLTIDVTDRGALRAAADGADIVVHMAGSASVNESWKNPERAYDVHFEGTANALDAARRAGVSRFVYLSSAEVYGRPASSPVTEDHPLSPRSPYGFAKAAAERAVRAWTECFGIPSVILRPFSVYGPGASPTSLVSSIAHQANSGDTIVVADLRPVRDYVFVRDLVGAIVSACDASVAASIVANVGSGRGTSVAELARLVLGRSSRSPTIVEDPTCRRDEHAEIFELVADVNRARELLGWTASTSLDAGLALTLEGAADATATGSG